jgi:hypothetical protein
MRNIFPCLLISAAMSPGLARAQSNTYPFPSSGNVGIGTTSPDGLLSLGGATGIKELSYDGNLNYNAGLGCNLIPGMNSFDLFAGYGNGAGNTAINFVMASSVWPYSGFSAKMTILGNGNVGIGTTGPSTLLNVSGNGSGTDPQLRIGPAGQTGSSTSIPAYLDFYSTFDDFPSDQGPRRTATIKAQFSGGAWGDEVLVFEVGTGGTNDAANEPTERMRITGNGSVGIGTSNPGYLLDVNGTIHSREVIVDNSGADYVFEKGYKLMPLADVAQAIERDKHLPGIPSSETMKSGGMGLGELETKLLAKIEELTLYEIEQEKRLNAQQAEIERLKSNVSSSSNVGAEKTGNE